MDLKWPWALPVVAVAVLVLLLWWARRPRPRRPDDALLVAHTARLRGLPRYVELLRRRRLSGLLLALAALVVVAGTALVLIRPQQVDSEPRQARSRDLMLCLDASVSMDDDNLAVVREVRRIVDDLRGDRVGLMIWSGAAVLVFPLTDDYDFVRAQLDAAERAFAGEPDGFFAGVDSSGGASLIGDGIVSCVQRFDDPSADRTRAVLVSSDNSPIGEPVYPLPEAARYATEQKVLVYGLGAAELGSTDRAAAREELAAAVEATGGLLALVGEDGDTDRIVERIDDLEKARAEEPPRKVSYDDNRVGLLVSALGVGLLLLAWTGPLLGRRRARRA